MNTSSSCRSSASAISRWTLDTDGCRLFLVLPASRFLGLTLTGAQGALELREEELVGSRLSIQLPPGPQGPSGEIVGSGYDYRGSASRRGPASEIVLEGRLRVGDRVDPLTLVVTPTRYHRAGGTEYLDLEVAGSLPSNRCRASRVEGRLRLMRASPAA